MPEQRSTNGAIAHDKQIFEEGQFGDGAQEKTVGDSSLEEQQVHGLPLPTTQRHLKNYQVTMIGFCSGIGVGLFVGTGAAYAKAGPAGLLLAYLIVGSVLWCVMQSIGEVSLSHQFVLKEATGRYISHTQMLISVDPQLATVFPTAGTFPHWATRFIDPSVGFSLAITYTYCYAISIASEVSAAAILVSYWTDITPAVVITISLVLILAINLCNVRYFGETEVVSGVIKVSCFIGVLLTALVITCGGGPDHETIGFRYWHNPGPWTNYNGIPGSTGHFLGFLSAFVNAAFSFLGIECVVISAAESIHPHRDIPRATRRVTYRIGFFYILGALFIGLIVDPRNVDLVSGSGNANSSPWVIAIRNAGISSLPSIVNACILVSAWSAGNSYCWASSRTMISMTRDGHLPLFFGRVSKQGVPYVAVIVCWSFGLLAYLSEFGTNQSLKTSLTWCLNH